MLESNAKYHALWRCMCKLPMYGIVYNTKCAEKAVHRLCQSLILCWIHKLWSELGKKKVELGSASATRWPAGP